MDFAGLFGKIVTDIAAFGTNFGLQLAHFIDQNLHIARRLRRQARHRTGCRRGLVRSFGSFGIAFAGAGFRACKIGGHQGTAHMVAATDRTGQEARLALRVEGGRVTKPAFKFMLCITDKLIFDHYAILP